MQNSFSGCAENVHTSPEQIGIWDWNFQGVGGAGREVSSTKNQTGDLLIFLELLISESNL